MNAKRIATYGIPLVGALAVYKYQSLAAAYPILPAKPYHRTAAVLPKLPQKEDFGEIDYIYALIPNSPASANPLDRLLDAFWPTWTLRVEGAVAALFNFEPKSQLLGPIGTGKTRANGVFVVYDRYDDSEIDQWQFTPTVGGVQELSAVEVDGGKELELAYGCAQYGLPSTGVGLVALRLHQFYMRFLLDEARKRMLRRQRQ